MELNPLAEAANEILERDCPRVYDLLSATGKALFFPKGILTQSAEAKAGAHRHNATIGIATEGGEAMHLACVHRHFADLAPDDCYPYAPSTGLPELREAWSLKQRDETPSLEGHPTSMPVASNALTHGLDLVGELFLDPGDEVLLPDKMWGNYRMTYGVLRQARLATFPFFTDDLTGFAREDFAAALDRRRGNKLVVVLNFPNNPTGYSVTEEEADAIVAALTGAAEAGTRIVAICDDAYYGMFFDEACARESLFGRLAKAHENLLAVKVDGATKEMFVWGVRVGFVTYGVKNGTAEAYRVLEQKTGGAVRGSVSNINRPGQSIVLAALRDPGFREQQAGKIAILRERAEEVRRLVHLDEYADCWDVYPFNAGYFMCLRLKSVDAEAVRTHLLEEHGVGTIALGGGDLRVAFSCVEKGDLPDLFERIAQSVRAVRGT